MNPAGGREGAVVAVPQMWGAREVDVFTEAHVAYAALAQWLDHCEEMAGQGVMVDGYAWTDDEDGVALADAVSRVDPRMREVLTRQARAFAAEHLADLSTWFDPSQAGYDLWMTRTGQGTGFWSRYLPTDRDDTFSRYAVRVRHDPAEVAEFDAAKQRLSDAAHALPHVETYVVADGRIHLMTASEPPAPRFAGVRAAPAGLLRRLTR